MTNNDASINYRKKQTFNNQVQYFNNLSNHFFSFSLILLIIS